MRDTAGGPNTLETAMFKLALTSFAAAAVLAAPVLAHAEAIGPVGSINVSIAPELAAKTREFSNTDFDTLKDELRRSVETQLKRKGRLDASGGVLDLVITDAKSTRPTIRQMSVKPGLSYDSFALGGAELTGTYRAADGGVTPLKYDWYETDLRNASYGWTFQAAADGFQRFAMKLTRN